jgi:hypothetical protein
MSAAKDIFTTLAELACIACFLGAVLCTAWSVTPAPRTPAGYRMPERVFLAPKITLRTETAR